MRSFRGLAVMALGWAFGEWWRGQLAQGAAGESRVLNLLVRMGLLALVVFLVQRGIDSYGNMWLERTDAGWLRWLQVSKYPPSLAFYALTLGVMALGLAGLRALVSHGALGAAGGGRAGAVVLLSGARAPDGRGAGAAGLEVGRLRE